MNSMMALLTPLLVFFIVALFGFVGCGDALPYDADPEPEPEPETPKPKTPKDPAGPFTGPPTGPYLPPPPATYEALVSNTDGFQAFWPLDEMSGKEAVVVGASSPDANGDYKSVTGADPALGSYTQGKTGVKSSPTNQKDFAVEFAGTEAYLEVPFIPDLNPTPMGLGFTVELWVKPNPNGGSDRHGLVSSHHFDSITSQQGYEVGLLKVQGQQHQQIYGRVYGGPAATISEIFVQPDDGDGDPSDWRYIAFKYEFVSGKGYLLRLRARIVNSAKVYTKESTAAILYENVTPAKQSTLRFGGTHLQPPGTSSVLAGQLDNIAIYAAPVPDTELDLRFTFVQ